MSLGMMSTLFGAAQLIGGPVLGRVADRYGRKVVLLISIFGSAFGYYMLSYATTITILFLSRIPVGLVKQTMTISKAYISDIAEPSNRSKLYGMLGTFSGLGFIVGNAIAGFVFGKNMHAAAQCAAALYVGTFLLVQFFLPESKVVASAEEQKKPSIADSFRAVSQSNVGKTKKTKKNEKRITLCVNAALLTRQDSTLSFKARSASLRFPSATCSRCLQRTCSC
jgi:DHA1 family tetracycline resistance protein-like MFS transporter